MSRWVQIPSDFYCSNSSKRQLLSCNLCRAFISSPEGGDSILSLARRSTCQRNIFQHRSWFPWFCALSTQCGLWTSLRIGPVSWISSIKLLCQFQAIICQFTQLVSQNVAMSSSPFWLLFFKNSSKRQLLSCNLCRGFISSSEGGGSILRLASGTTCQRNIFQHRSWFPWFCALSTQCGLWTSLRIGPVS